MTTPKTMLALLLILGTLGARLESPSTPRGHTHPPFSGRVAQELSLWSADDLLPLTPLSEQPAALEPGESSSDESPALDAWLAPDPDPWCNAGVRRALAGTEPLTPHPLPIYLDLHRFRC